MTIPLSEKYRPKRFSEIRGQDAAISKVRAFIYSFEKGLATKKAMLLHGPPGTGKTSLACVLANELGYELFELNASDLRNRQKLEEVMKPSTEQKSLFSRGKIILVDEVDGVTSTDYGGVAELIALTEKTKHPILITANDVWQQKFSLLRQKCELVKFAEIPYYGTLEFIREILKNEDKAIEEVLLAGIAAKCKGDLRAALNDLQSVINLEEGEITGGDIDEREKSESIFNALKNVFKLKTSRDTLGAFDSVDMESDQIILWLEKNIPLEYHGSALARAFEALSKADVFKGRVYRQQHWRFLVYQNILLTAGISSASAMKNPGDFTKYERPTRILKIWMANQKNAKKKSIAAKYAEYTHTSKKRALKDFFMIAMILDDDAARKLNLSDQEKEFLLEYRGALKIAHGLNRFAVRNINNSKEESRFIHI